MNQYLVRANELKEEMVKNRRHFHRYPEVRNELFETTKYVREQLEEMGYEVEEICQCGLVAISGGAFSMCSSLEGFDIDSKNSDFTVIEGVLYRKDTDPSSDSYGEITTLSVSRIPTRNLVEITLFQTKP